VAVAVAVENLFVVAAAGVLAVVKVARLHTKTISLLRPVLLTP
jgi:hypothetical protein